MTVITKIFFLSHTVSSLYKCKFQYNRQNFIIFSTIWWKIPNIFGNSHRIQFPTALWFSTIGELKLCSINFPCLVNWNCLNYGGNKIKLYPFPTCWELIFHIKHRNVNPSPIHGNFFLTLEALWKSNQFFSLVKDWVIHISIDTEYWFLKIETLWNINTY